ncbi:MAG: amino acid permease [Hyphomonadaceae bacterium]|nr:amino acid permease [Hyphomonadaceae bacterium]
MSRAASEKPLGFWACWALVVGCMIGSGVFMLPTLMAPYGLISFGGWIIAGAGSIALGLIFGRLAARTNRDGGPYIYAQEAFGGYAGFAMAWAYWFSFVVGVPVVAIAFAGYLGVFFPAIAQSSTAQAVTALAAMAAFTIINIRGLREMSAVQIAMTLLKVVPLFAIIGLAAAFGTPANLPAFNPSNSPILTTLSAVTLIALWPFTGFEVVTLPAGAVQDPERTIPRALVAGMLFVTFVYLAATTAVMLLVPAQTLAQSSAPFAEAARAFGPWGAPFIALGALIATGGTLNGLIFTTGQMPMAVALDRHAPRWLATTNAGGAPYLALLLSSGIGALLLIANYTRGFIGAFEFLLKMATSLSLIYYFVCALAELKYSWRKSGVWGVAALAGLAYAAFAMLGSGLEVLGWGLALMTASVPLYFLLRPSPS